MKFNWGHGIALLMTAFVAFIATLVYGTFQERIDLSSEDYYQREVDYEAEKSAIENGLSAGEVAMTVNESQLTLQMPEGGWSDIQFLLKRPDNADFDVDGRVEAMTENNVFRIDRPQPLGWWDVEITALSEEKEYRWEFKKYF